MLKINQKIKFYQEISLKESRSTVHHFKAMLKSVTQQYYRLEAHSMVNQDCSINETGFTVKMLTRSAKQ